MEGLEDKGNSLRSCTEGWNPQSNGIAGVVVMLIQVWQQLQ